MADLLSSPFNVQMKLLNGRGRLTVDLDGPVPVVIFNQVKVAEIGSNCPPKMSEVPVLILIIPGKTGKIKGEVFLIEGLSPLVQGLTDPFLLRTMTGPEEKEE